MSEEGIYERTVNNILKNIYSKYLPLIKQEVIKEAGLNCDIILLHFDNTIGPVAAASNEDSIVKKIDINYTDLQPEFKAFDKKVQEKLINVFDVIGQQDNDFDIFLKIRRPLLKKSSRVEDSALKNLFKSEVIFRKQKVQYNKLNSLFALFKPFQVYNKQNLRAKVEMFCIVFLSDDLSDFKEDKIDAASLMFVRIFRRYFELFEKGYNKLEINKDFIKEVDVAIASEELKSGRQTIKDSDIDNLKYTINSNTDKKKAEARVLNHQRLIIKNYFID